MAEVLAVVASGAGLASLAIQLASEVQKLRKRHENLARLHGDIATVVEDLETVIIDLHDLEPATNDLLEQQIGPILVKRCRSGSASATERLANLSDIITARSSKRHTLKVIHRSPEWKTELRELQSMVTGLKQDLVRYCVPIILKTTIRSGLEP
ncbi:Fc.00g001380.m01.CDS01 [Cosmosporella sp. VM-42]